MFFKEGPEKVDVSSKQKDVISMFLEKNTTSTYNIIVDGSNLYMRALTSKSYEYFNAQGQDVAILRKALFSFFYNLRQILSKFEMSNKHKVNVDNIYVVFDRGGSIRHRELFDGYKNKKVNSYAALSIDERDDDQRQFALFMKLLDLLPRVKIFFIPYAEGDLIASYLLTKYSLKAKNILVTGDKDYIQLLAYYPSVVLYYLSNKKSNFYDLFTFNSILNFSTKLTPKEYLIVKTMLGDPSDSIPGISRIGKKKSCDVIEIIRGVNGKKNNPYGNVKGFDLISKIISSDFKVPHTEKEIKEILNRNFQLMNLVNYSLLTLKQKKEVENILEFDKFINSNASNNFAVFREIIDREKIRMNFDTYVFIQRLFSM